MANLETKEEREAYIKGYEEGIKLYAWDSPTQGTVVGYPYARPIKEAIAGMRASLAEWLKEGKK